MADKTEKTTTCYCGKEAPYGARRCPHCGHRLGTAADFGAILFLVFGVPLGLFMILASEEPYFRVIGGIVLAVSLIVALAGGVQAWRGERKAKARDKAEGREEAKP